MAEEIGVTVEVKGMEEILKKLEPQFLSGPMGDFLKRSIITVQGKARVKSPVDTGLLRSSIGYEVDRGIPPMLAKTGTSVFYAPYQEFGTGTFVGRRVHWPPGQALGLWAEKHGTLTGSEIASIIGHHGGLRPRRFLRGGLEESLSAIRGFLADLGREIERKWRGQ
jgi:hypothetical protein